MIKPERCVLLSQLYEKITLEEVKHFLSPVGKIQSLQLEFCEDSHKFKKSAIVEFENTECVLLALGLNGQKLKGNFTIIQPIMRRQQLDSCNRHKTVTLKVDNVRESDSEEKLEKLFKPFGSLSLQIISTKRDTFAEVIFDRLNMSLAAIREVNESGRYGLFVSIM